MGAASAPPNTRSKDKEGPSTARKGREGTARKGREGTARKEKERPTLAGQRQSCGVGMKEQVREHLERELAKKKNKEPPLDPRYILHQLDKLRRSFTRSMSLVSHLLIILKKTMSQMLTSDNANVPFFVQPNVDTTNRGSSVCRDSVVDSRAKGI